MHDIKLFVCCHEPVPVPAHPLLYPLQVGTALTGEHFFGFSHDDDGDNISSMNRFYCELTGQYWAWKNVQADWYGFFHYRRYLYPDIQARRPYVIMREPVPNKLGFDRFSELIGQYDMILPMEENMYISVREQYGKIHRNADLVWMEQHVQRMHPEIADALEKYLCGTRQFFGNIYIMRRGVFQDYCTWLFPMLAAYDSEMPNKPHRTDGYLAERLLGVYATYRCRGIKTLELPRAHFFTGWEYTEKRMLNAILPPGTRRRAAVKSFVKSFCG